MSKSKLCPATSRKFFDVEPKVIQPDMKTAQCPICERWFAARKLQTGEWAWPRHTTIPYIQHRSANDQRTKEARAKAAEKYAEFDAWILENDRFAKVEE